MSTVVYARYRRRRRVQLLLAAVRVAIVSLGATVLYLVLSALADGAKEWR